MSTFYNKDSDNFIHATVVTSQKIIDLIGKDLPGHFFKHRVSLVSMSPALNFGSDAVTLILAGKENDIKASLGILKKICQDKEYVEDVTPIRSLPPSLKGYLSDMEDDLKFKKVFSYCSKEYLEYCKSHHIKPHPEVAEASS